MQVGLINLVKRYFSFDAKISVVSVFGINQIEGIQQEYDHSITMGVELLGGLKPTFYPMGLDNKKTDVVIVDFLNALFFAPSILLLLLVIAGIPVSLVAQFLPFQAKKTLMALVESDVIIWNGRNFRSRKSRLLEVYRILHLIYHPLLAIALSKPVACIGASVWEFNNPFVNRLLKAVFERCYFISLREQNSYVEAEKILGVGHSNQIRLLPDLSFAAFEQAEQILKNRNRLSNTKLPQKIGFTIVDWKSDGEAVRISYKIAIQGTIRSLIKNGSQIVLIPQVTKKWENFEELLEEITSGLDSQEIKEITVIRGEPSVMELLNIYAQLDFLVATRMHSAIFASAVQTPLVAISYDSGGKWSILEKLGYADFIIPYSEITPLLLLDRITACWNHKDILLKEVHRNVTENIKQVDLNISLVSEMLNNMHGNGR